jgi:hypothetical protein
MKFKATEAQVKQICINAIAASLPMGMGHLHYNPAMEVKPEQITVGTTGMVNLDYVGGRMVKLVVQRESASRDEWKIIAHREKPTVDYQSWAHKYPTWRALVKSVPEVEILE